MNMNSQDWDTVVLRKKQPTGAALKDEAAVNAVRGASVPSRVRGC